MTTVAELSGWMERFAPSGLAESWDNVGLLWGDPAAEVIRVMTCLTLTREVAEEAVDERVGLVVTHHPILFRPVQRITADRPEGATLWRLARVGIAIYCPHTALDNTRGGINDGLARRIGLRDVRPLRPSRGEDRCKLVVFVPAGDREAVLEAAFAAGAGRILDYRECSFSTGGRGTFFGMEGTDPTVGEPGRRMEVREWKVEMVCPTRTLSNVLAAVRAVHSYEVPAIDVVPLRSEPDGPGVGRLGDLPSSLSFDEFAARVREALKTGPLGLTGPPSRGVRRVAVACGAGDDFLREAEAAGADCLVTGEARFHRAIEAQAFGVALLTAGHYATERPGVEDLAVSLAAAFPEVEAWASRRESDPFRLI